MIRKIKMMLLVLLSCTQLLYVQAQSKKVSGVVTSQQTGKPLPGVSISLQNKILGVTDASGRFNVEVPNDATLLFQYIGYANNEITVGDRNILQVKLLEDNKALEEVVVVGYGEVQRKDLTGAVGSVNMQDIKKAPVGSALEALAGRVAGVQVTSESGKPGSDLNIVIRGANSLTQDNSPLYVIDGFPLEDANNGILNPDEIESIEILKDASATAIYGARGANGVILITTKKGEAGPPQINYTGYVGSQNIINTIDLMDGYEFVRLQQERDPVGSQENYFRDGLTLEDYRTLPSYDWQDVIFRDATMHNHSLSVMGGNANTKYSFSGNIFDQQGIIINSGFSRKQGKITLDQNFNKLKVGINATYSSTLTNGSNPATPESNFSAMNYLMFSIWGYRPVSFPNEDLLNDMVDDLANPTNDYRFNPVLSAQNELRENYNNRLIVNAYAEYPILPYLKLRITGGINNSDLRNDTFNNSKTRYGFPGSTMKVNGSILYTQSNTWLNENLLTFNKKIKDHTLNAVVGLTFQENAFHRYGMSAIQLPNESKGLAGLSEGIPQPLQSIKAEWAMLSYLARLNYNYKGRYLLTTSFRADGSSKFLGDNRFGYFPSAAFAWRLIDESFMKKQTLFSDAKVRVGYGVTGNNRVSEYAAFSPISFNNSSNVLNGYYSWGNSLIQGLFLPNIGSPNLVWESTAQSNVGIDVGMFKNRLLFTVDYYDKRTYDLLLNASLPPSIGYLNAFKNIGETKNKGIEITVSGDIIKKQDFQWNGSFNISFNRNRIVALTENQESLTSNVFWDQDYRTTPLYIAKIGQPLGQMYGYIWDGVYGYEDFDQQPNGSYVLKPNVTTNGNTRNSIQPGDIKYSDLNGDGVVDNLDRTVIGRGYPIHQGGFANTFNYKNIDLHLFFQWSYGNDVFNANRLLFETGDKAHLNQYATYIDRWTPENSTSNMPRVNGQGPKVYSSRVVEDGSYLRLKTASVGYTFGGETLARLKIKNLRVYASVQNILTWTNYSGFDPEVAVYYSALTPGFDYSSYPRPKTFVFGLNVNL
ncbi:SusC/RagA family TonB-linked outer membrane protein [Sphingobacterium phlebotomi]|nr:TonB-dependent receptor [Sphingobacterium phlebotomi]